MIATTETAILARLSDKQQADECQSNPDEAAAIPQSALSRARAATIYWPGLEDEAQ